MGSPVGRSGRDWRWEYALGEFSGKHERRDAIITYHLQLVDDGQHRGLFLHLLRNEPLEKGVRADLQRPQTLPRYR